MKNSLRVSFCTTCMNRAYHIKQTLKKNIINNLSYQFVEFVLLDYNSSDDLQSYVKNDLLDFVKNGKLVYYRTDEVNEYNMSHSRNIAFRLATGDIVCNIDADNFTGPDFAEYVNNAFVLKKNIFLSTHYEGVPKKDVLGRICLRKNDFLAVGGYDEKMKHYGFDDFDLVNRLEMYGLQKEAITSSLFLDAIPHSNEDRMKNSVNVKSLKKLLIRHISPAESNMLFLFKNNTFSHGNIINNRNYNAINSDKLDFKSLKYRYSLKQPSMEYGQYTVKSNKINLSFTDKNDCLYPSGEGFSSITSGGYYIQINDARILEELMFFLHQISNRNIMENNIVSRNIKVNNGEFGKTTVYKNFTPSRIIL